MDSHAYLNTIKLKLATSPSVSDAEILQEWGMDDKGFFRARLRLANGDFVEVAEFFMIDQDEMRTIEYRALVMVSSRNRVFDWYSGQSLDAWKNSVSFWPQR